MKDIEQYKQQLQERGKGTFWETLGCELEAWEEKSLTLSLQVEDKHLNPYGILHGGVHASLMDNAMGLFCLLRFPEEQVVTTHLNLHYLQPIPKGKVRAVSTLVHQGKRTLTLEGKLLDEHGNVGSYATGTFRLLGKRNE